MEKKTLQAKQTEKVDNEGTVLRAVGKIDLSQFEKKPARKRERFPGRKMSPLYPPDSEIMKYYKERERIEKLIYHDEPMCFVLDSSVILKNGTSFDEIIDTVSKKEIKVIIPLQAINDLSSARIDCKLLTNHRIVSTEHSELNILPQEFQMPDRCNMILAVAAKNTSKYRHCLLVSEDAAVRMKASILRMELLNSDEFMARLSLLKQYLTERMAIRSGTKTENLDWGTILPFSLYSKMNHEEYVEDLWCLESRVMEEFGAEGGQETAIEDETINVIKSKTIDFEKYKILLKNGIDKNGDPSEYIGGDLNFLADEGVKNLLQYFVSHKYIQYNEIPLFFYRITGCGRPDYLGYQKPEIISLCKDLGEKERETAYKEFFCLFLCLSSRVNKKKVFEFFQVDEKWFMKNRISQTIMDDFYQKITGKRDGAPQVKKQRNLGAQ